MAGQSAMAVLRQLAIEEPERLELRSLSIGNPRARVSTLVERDASLPKRYCTLMQAIFSST